MVTLPEGSSEATVSSVLLEARVGMLMLLRACPLEYRRVQSHKFCVHAYCFRHVSTEIFIRSALQPENACVCTSPVLKFYSFKKIDDSVWQEWGKLTML